MREPANSKGRRRMLESRYSACLSELEARGLGAQSIPAKHAFSELETLEYLLMQVIDRRDVLPIANALMSEFGSLSAVLGAERRRLLSVPGVSTETADLLKFIFDVARIIPASDKSAEAPDTASSRPCLSNVREAAEYCAAALADRKEECVLQVLMDRDSRVISAFFAAAGGESGVSLPAELAVQNAVMCGAKGVVLAHNHPSGLVDPSESDIASTRLLADMLSKRGIRLYEHFICAGPSCRALFTGETIEL